MKQKDKFELEKEKKEIDLYRPQNCMWSRLNINPFNFCCQLRNNINTNIPETAYKICNGCKCFQNTNIDRFGDDCYD